MRLILLSSLSTALAVGVVSVLVVACGGSDSASTPTTNAPTEDAGGSTTNGPDGGATSNVDGSVTTNVPDGGGGDAATSTDDQRIDPIALGRSWTYDVTILGTYPLCRAGSNIGQVLSQKDVSGKSSFQVQSFCPAAGVSSYAVDGDHVEVFYGGVWVLVLDAPVVDGHTWSNGAATFIWQKTGSVTVAAGTFNDCWTAQQQGGESYTVFCRGVGPVHWHYVEGANGYDAVLTAKNF